MNINSTIFYDGTEYRTVADAILVPGDERRFDTAEINAIRANDVPDGIGAVDLYILKYVVLDKEDFENGPEWYDNVDWEDPDDCVRTDYKWLIAENKLA